MNVDFLNRIDGRRDHHVVEVLVGHRHPVEQIQVVPAALSEDVHQGPCLLQSVAAGSAGRAHDTFGQHREIQKLASFKRQRHGLLPVDRVAYLGRFQLYATGALPHLQDFGGVSHLQSKIAAQPVPGVNLHLRHHRLFEIGCTSLERIGPAAS